MPRKGRGKKKIWGCQLFEVHYKLSNPLNFKVVAFWKNKNSGLPVPCCLDCHTWMATSSTGWINCDEAGNAT
jgi:hypothetical protein